MVFGTNLARSIVAAGEAFYAVGRENGTQARRHEGYLLLLRANAPPTGIIHVRTGWVSAHLSSRASERVKIATKLMDT